MQHTDMLHSLPPETEIRLLVAEDLRQAWNYHREYEFRQNLKIAWSTVDGYLIVLDDKIRYAENSAREICNKATAFYYEQPAHVGQFTERGFVCLTRVILAALFEKWRALYDKDWDIEYGHFLANPIRITPRGPKNLKEIVASHAQICAQAREHPLENIHYQFQALYPAILIVCDRLDYEESDYKSDGFISLRKVAEAQSVLLVRTGVESPIPISFDSLKPHARPLERLDAESLDVIRVPLAVAVNFIVDLERKSTRPDDGVRYDRDRSLCRQVTLKGFDRIVNYDPDTWVHALMSVADKDAYEVLHDTWAACARVEARLAGETTDYELEQEWSPRWKP